MFMHNSGTKEMVDVLVMCRDALLNLPNQPIPKFPHFTDTRIMGDYLNKFIDTLEGRASGASKAKASSLSAANEVNSVTQAGCCGMCNNH